MNKKIMLIFALAISLIFAASPFAMAKVTAEEAAALKSTLTPFGAEKAGNKEGTIPAWDGGITAPPAGSGYVHGERYPDPFKDDKVLFSITAGNKDQYADKLTPGLMALLDKYSSTFRIDVYPAHRSFAAPQWVYDHTFENATRATLTEDSNGVLNAYGGMPFPIPQNGAEIMWNHTLRWQGESKTYTYTAYLIQPDGQVVLSSGSTVNDQYPYYYKNGSLETFKGDFWYFFSQYMEPARRKGELLLVRDPIDQTHNERRAWQYLTGQRRVRMAPTVAFDTPNPAFSGSVTYDESHIFNGSLERYDWKIVGKKEIYIPYNSFKSVAKMAPSAKYQKGHINPDYLRFELHRVWEVEANLKEGSRHSYARRVIYFDEDSYVAILSDSYDGRGKLWRTNIDVTLPAYDVPAVVIFMNLHHDLPSGMSAVNYDWSDHDKLIDFHAPLDESFFLPDQIRRFGR